MKLLLIGYVFLVGGDVPRPTIPVLPRSVDAVPAPDERTRILELIRRGAEKKNS